MRLHLCWWVHLKFVEVICRCNWSKTSSSPSVVRSRIFTSTLSCTVEFNSKSGKEILLVQRTSFTKLTSKLPWNKLNCDQIKDDYSCHLYQLPMPHQNKHVGSMKASTFYEIAKRTFLFLVGWIEDSPPIAR